MRQREDLTGRRQGRLVVDRRVSDWMTHGNTVWLCRCDCGSAVLVKHGYIQSGSTRSCGCFKRDTNRRKIETIRPRDFEEWHALLDTLEGVVTRFPQTPGQIRAEFDRQWGSCQDRRFWRALRALLDQGRICRQGIAQQPSSMYVRCVPWHRNLAECIAAAAATFAVYELGMRRSAA